MKKTRPCVVLSSERQNTTLGTVIIAPLTSTIREYPSRVRLNFKGKTGEVCLDQIRSIDEGRIVGESMGRISDDNVIEEIKDVIAEMFSL